MVVCPRRRNTATDGGKAEELSKKHRDKVRGRLKIVQQLFENRDHTKMTDEQVDRLHAEISLRVVRNRLARANKDGGGGTVGALLDDMTEQEVNDVLEQLQEERFGEET